ncbi:unnamed protein product [Trifolium pratense]|uniref:Uncharacterized protein n=1 Tax=Trifolium pratense TaxID=57577 RepID=A0ACB0LMA4_TRIPR|nr:unnamed protein product [Trifolium pratense]
MARKYEGPVIGIDLGTTYSRVAVWQEQNNSAVIIRDEQGNITIPSFVAFTNSQKLVGDAAKDQVASNPSNTIFDAKKLIGRKYSDPIIQNNLRLWPFKVISSTNDKPIIVVKYKGKEKHLFPEEILSMIIKKMLEMAEKFLESHVKNVVITVPAYFDNSQRVAMKDAGLIAGLNVMQIINEPIAAALTYGLYTRANCVENKNIFICDIGGGTFGVSLITLKGDKFEIKATAETQFGGEDFSDRMVNHFVKEFKRRHGIEISGNLSALRRLRIECERAKRTLSYRYEVIIKVDAICHDIYFDRSITRAKFEQLNMDLFEKFMNIVESCLTNAKIGTSSVDDVVLVGGSSKIPKIQNLLEDFFKKGVKLFDPDEAKAAAYGAAIQAALLSGGLKNVPMNVHQYLTRMSLAGEPIHGKIEKNKKVNVTIEDNKSSVTIDFQEGSGITINIPGSSNISLPDPAFELPINVYFAADSDGMLNVSAEVQTVSKDIIITNENVRLEH